MNNFDSALDLMKANIEHEIAEMDIKKKIDLSKLDSNQYRLLINSIARHFFKTGNCRMLSPKKINEYIEMITTSNVFDLTKNHRRIEILSQEAKKTRDDLLLAVSLLAVSLLAVSLSKTSENSESFDQYETILRKRYRRLCDEIKSSEFGEKA